MLNQVRDILAPLAQRRNANLDHLDAEVQVLAKLALGDHRFEVLVGRRDDPDVGGERLIAADPLELLLLQHAQELGLGLHIHVADFVEEQGAAVRGLEFSFAACNRPGEGTLLMPEQFALDQLARERGAIDRDERAAHCAGSWHESRARRVPCRCPTRRE